MTALFFTFLLGIANFTLHKAVLESGHALLGRMPFVNTFGPRASLVAEFIVLLGAMLLVGSGNPVWAWAYLGYTVMNGLAAWLILSRRI